MSWGEMLLGVHKAIWYIQSCHTIPVCISESTIPNSRSVVKGVTGGSVAIVCPYNPKESSSLKYWCHWEADENGRCPVLVGTQALVQEGYEGRLALFDQPGSGAYTVILNQLTTQDSGFYWCLTDGDSRWRTTIELQVAEGERRSTPGGGRRLKTIPIAAVTSPRHLFCYAIFIHTGVGRTFLSRGHISTPVTSTPGSFNHHLPHFPVSEGLAYFALGRYPL